MSQATGISRARLVVDPAFALAEVDDRMFSSFVEHMGRAVYGGVYEPAHPSADEHGYRGDVIALVRELGLATIRYPDLDAYLACSQNLAWMIESVAATADAVAARRRSRRRIGLSVDEWNIWHMRENPSFERGGAPLEHAPPIAEDTHTLADALVVGCLLITLLRHADRVRIACLAQLLNTIAPIRTLDGGPAWRQTTYYPFLHASRHGRGTVLRIEPEAPSRVIDGEGSVSLLEATAVLSGDRRELTLFAVNRGAEPLAVDAVLRDLPGAGALEHIVLAGEDPLAVNDAGHPDRVRPATLAPPAPDRGALHVTLPPRSWNVVRLATNATD